MGLYQEKSIIEMPFLLMTDEALKYLIRMNSTAGESTADPTQAPTQEPTEAPTEPPTEPPVIQVDQSWFDDALFIGNSLTTGLRDYGCIDNAVSLGIG